MSQMHGAVNRDRESLEEYVEAHDDPKDHVLKLSKGTEMRESLSYLPEKTAAILS
jgi:hypothetical protein